MQLLLGIKVTALWQLGDMQKQQVFWWNTYHAGVDDLSFPWFCPLQQREHYP